MADKPRIVPDPLVYSRQGDTTVLRPQAAPVDTFVRPAEPTRSPLWDLAQSLSEVRPTLNKFIAERFNEMGLKDAREAEAKAMVSQAQSLDEAITKGEIAPGQSPIYQRVFTETLGKLYGLNHAQATLWQQWVAPDNPVRSSQDPDVISKWFAERRARMMEGRSPDWVKGFAPAFNQTQQQLTQHIISNNVKAIEDQNHDALGQLFMERIMAGTAAGKSPEEIAATLADDSLPQRFAGMRGKEINTIVAKAIIAVAERTGNVDLLKIGFADRPDIKNPGSAATAIGTIEGGGRYDAIGPIANSKGQRAYGKYQVMDFNIGPWTKEVLGTAMTPQEFLKNPQAQDAVFNAKFGQYVKQYGSQAAAARAWFAGPGGMNNPNATDVLGTSVRGYEQKFIKGVFTIPEFAVAASNAQTSILAKATAAEQRAALAEARVEKHTAQSVMVQIVEAKLKDPNYEPPPELILQGVKADPTFASKMATQLAALTKVDKPRFDPQAFNALSAQFVTGIQQGKDVTPIIAAMAPYGTASQILEWNKMATTDNVLKSPAYHIADQSLQKMQDTLSAKLEPYDAARKVNDLRQEFFSYAWSYEQAALAKGQRVDPEKMSADFQIKIREMAERAQTEAGILPTPATKSSAPQAPGQQGAAQPPPGTPASVTDALNIVPLSKEASGPRQWPEGEHPWSAPPPGVQVDAAEVNALRTSPFVKNGQGLAYWQAFETKYGPGSAKFFITNNPNAIAAKLRGK